LPLIVRITVPYVVDENVSDWPASLSTVTQLHVQRIPQTCELLARSCGIIKEVKHKLWVEPKATGFVKVTYDAPGRA